MEDILKEISKKLFSLFVVNQKAIAVQRADGNYTTQYTRVTEDEVYCMLKEKKSLGTYQQLYKSPYLKWICLDFDCKDKEEPDIPSLYKDCIVPINNYLQQKGIKYIDEFSGRRGIHIWILFDKLIQKNVAYNIIQKIINDSKISIDSNKYGLDKFPANAISKGNVIGKQVKIPLSTHKKGGCSYFISDKYEEKDTESLFFYEEQLKIINSIEINKFDELLSRLEIDSEKPKYEYKKMYIDGDIECSSEKLINILSQTTVFKQIFDRFQHGQPFQKDWFVLLGTLGKIGNSYDYLLEVLKYSPDYSEEQSIQKIKQFGSKYYPATFKYLYDMYNLKMEEFINPDENGLQFLARELGLENLVKEKNWDKNEKEYLSTSKYTVEKEKNYLLANDEVPVVSILLDLEHFTDYDIKKIDEKIDKIMKGEKVSYEPSNYKTFLRYESETKTRNMISLCAHDRVFTTQLALKLIYNNSKLINSYSYNPNYLSEKDVFFHWFTSWGYYLENIRKYLEIDIYEKLNVITLDISHFYDSIDFLGVYSLLKDYLSAEENNIILFLITYNEKLMQKIKSDRHGVPQGPAYARLIAEIFLGLLINFIKEKFDNSISIKIYRYVDDIIIFHEDSINGQDIYNLFERDLAKYGLFLNKDKSHIYGKIKDLTDSEKEIILRKNQFQYGLRENNFSYLIPKNIINEKIKKILNENTKFDISNMNYFFSKYTTQRAKIFFFKEYAENIFSCVLGRGTSYLLFYSFVFEKADLIEYSLRHGYLKLIPINTINFSCFLACLFYAYRNKVVITQQIELINGNLQMWNEDDILNEEDKNLLIALKQKDVKND